MEIRKDPAPGNPDIVGLLQNGNKGIRIRCLGLLDSRFVNIECVVGIAADITAGLLKFGYVTIMKRDGFRRDGHGERPHICDQGLALGLAATVFPLTV